MKNQLAAVLCALTLFVMGCGDQDEFVVVQPQPQAPVPFANLRVVNPAGDVSNLVVSVDGAVVDADLDAQESTPYLQMDPGQHTIVITDGVNTLVTEQVTLAENTFYSSFFIPRPVFPAQTTVTQPALSTLTDNITPTAGTLNARLIYASNFDGEAALFNDQSQILLGPVEEAQNTGYVAQGASAADSSLFAVLFDINEIPATQRALFTQESNGDQLVESLINEVGVSGVNISIFVHVSLAEQEAYITSVIDEGDDGSRAILSTAPLQVNPQ